MFKGRNQAIDAFRGVAITGVILYHYLVRWAPPFNAENVYGYEHLYPAIFSIGKFGVHLFFVISGFVITMTVLRSTDAIDFAVKRFARLYPPLFVAGAFTLVVTQFGPEILRATPWDYIAGLTMFPNQLGADWVDGSYWSLQVEIKFYAIVAVSFVILGARFWIGLVILGWLGLCGPVLHIGPSVSLFSFWPFFMLGASGWYAFVERARVPAVSLFLTSAVMLVLNGPGVGATIAVVACAALMFALMYFEFSVPIFPIVGRISYSLYLIHQIAGVVFIGALKGIGVSDMMSALITVVVMIIISTLMFKYVEAPGQKMVMNIWKSMKGYRSKGEQAA